MMKRFMSKIALVSAALVAIIGVAAQSQAAGGACGRPVSNGQTPVASDALYVLRSAVGSTPCAACVCDTDGSGSMTAIDALIDLKAAVGQPVNLSCPVCATTSSTSTSTTLPPATTTTITPPTTTTTLPDEPAALEGITAAHNAVRAGVGVAPLTWSASLAATAQAWAEACVDDAAPVGLIDHNPNRSDGHPYYVGENIYGSSGVATPDGAVALWAAEEQDYDYATNACSAVCGHYTQVVWATTLEVGCGIATCPGLTYGSGIVCDYGPGGNTGGRPY